MATVRFKTDFRGAAIGELREVSDNVARQWRESGYVSIVAEKATTAPAKNKSMGRPKSGKKPSERPVISSGRGGLAMSG